LEDAAKTMVQTFVISRLDYCNALCYSITDELTRCLQSVQNAAARLVTGTRRCDHISPVYAAALASCAAVCRVQDCDSRPPVLVRQRPRLPGRRLSARRRRPCQTTAFCRHSNTRCQSEAQQFWRQDLCRCRTTSLEQSATQSQTMWAVIRPVQAFTCRHRTTSLEQSAAQSQTMWAVIRPVQAITQDIFIRTVRPRRSVNCYNCAE